MQNGVHKSFMDIVSYRGEGAGGGVSSALKAAVDNFADSQSRWWFLEENDLSCLQGKNKPQVVSCLENDLVQGHYRYCNEFIWPLMHDLPQFAVYHEGDRTLYKEFNRRISNSLQNAGCCNLDLFVHDYQFALLPGLLKASKMSLFWHIPWPRQVSHHFSEQITELCENMLECSKIGFHTSEYAVNFILFVLEFLPNFKVDLDNLIVKNRKNKKCTQILVRPLGLDLKFWKGAQSEQKLSIELPDTPFILSVDRADYTKGIMQRLETIDNFFRTMPEYLGKMAFVQVCQKTRPGLRAFDNYWDDCRDYADEILNRFSSPNWKPLYWHTKPVTQKELSCLYRKASIMLVNPVRDGLNLTAKEYVASLDANTDSGAGVLMLSTGAGVFDELGGEAIAVNPKSSKDMVESLRYSLKLPGAKRQRRINSMKRQLQTNSLEKWWQDFQLTS